jgi:ATP-dependent exoDNAse (exonuclease V) beta subunit
MNGPPDRQQREQSRNPERSFIVQAPAGSGKTELLTQRMLGLLARVEHPEEVVAITFTRKAAAEMAHRLVERLREARDKPAETDLEPHQRTSRELALAVLENDRRRGWSLLDQPSRLRVRTIDGLCADLARQLPLLSRLGGGQQVAENADELYRQAATRAMAVIEKDDDDLQADVVRVLDRYDNQYDRLVDLLTGMLANRDQWLPHLLELRDGDGFSRAALEDTLSYLVESELAEAAARIPPDLLQGLPGVLNYACSNDPGDRDDLGALLEACCPPGSGSLCLPADARALPHWKTLVRRLLVGNGSKFRSSLTKTDGFPAPSQARGEERERRQHWKDAFLELLNTVRENDSLREQLNRVASLPDPEYDDEAWASLQSLMRILLRAIQEWELVMEDTGAADFSEIAYRALKALGSEEAPSDLALRLDYRIQHLLVDEFQDTSHSQVRLLERLTSGWSEGDGHTLFLVGDPMQSIYRFRKAEVSLFIKAFEGRLFPQLQLQPLTLQVNFRSTAKVVQWVNRVFDTVLPDHNDPVRGAVSYSPAKPRPGAGDAGGIETWLQPLRDDEAEAVRVIEIIGRAGPDEEIAILVRSRKHAADILALLDRLKQGDDRYRYRAVQFNPLAETVLIQDLVSLTLALLQPSDRLAWLSVLRAPYLGLDLADLEILAHRERMESLPEAIQAPGPDISDSGRRRLARAAPVLAAAAAQCGRRPVRSLTESAWLQLGGPACTTNASELDDAATFFDLLGQLEEEGLPIDRETLQARLENLYAEPDARAGENLQVMTVYAAKGLQFDRVILPGLNRDTGNDKQKLMYWFELADIDQIVLSPMRNVEEKARQKHSGDLVRFISGVERERQKLENGRLLYVAATRARHSLHLLGAIKPNRDGEFHPGSMTLLGELWPAVHEEQTCVLDEKLAVLEQTCGNGTETEQHQVFPQIYRRLPAGWLPPAAPNPVSTSPAEIPEPPEPVQFQWAGEDARLAGNLVHRLLQQIAEQGADQWQHAGGMARQESWCRQHLRSEGATGSKADSIVRRTALAIENCLSSRHGRWILDRHEEAGCEYAITAVLHGRPVNFVLDRTFVDDGIRWIIDYKTSSHTGGNLEAFIENEKARYRDQLDRYREALALSENRPIRTALYLPLLDQLIPTD